MHGDDDEAIGLMHATEKLHTYLLGSHGMVCIGVVKLLDVSYDYSSAASLPSILTTSVCGVLERARYNPVY